MLAHADATSHARRPAATARPRTAAGKAVWHGENAWSGRPRVEVGLGVDSAAVVALIKERITTTSSRSG